MSIGVEMAQQSPLVLIPTGYLLYASPFHAGASIHSKLTMKLNHSWFAALLGVLCAPEQWLSYTPAAFLLIDLPWQRKMRQ